MIAVFVSVTPAVAQGASSPAPAPVDPRADAAALVSQLDRLLAEGRSGEVQAVYDRLLTSRTAAAAAGLDLVSSGGASSEFTVRFLCEIASEDVVAETKTSVLAYVLSSPNPDDLTKMGCIRRLADRADDSFREPLVQIAKDPDRDPNLRIAALKATTSNWPQAGHATLVELLRSAQEPILHHKAQQYLALSQHPDALDAIERFVLNRDPATAGSALSKEYGLLLLRFRREDRAVPLLASILRDESWPGEIQDRTIDLLANSDLPGGRAILMEIRARCSDRLKARIDALVGAREEGR